ncbi:MAG: tetratricopeptide repeat protein [Jatrophihabitans sp.]|nr:MAG: tetratricopeptide repeat protein [Jatrophihabitans sp.]
MSSARPLDTASRPLEIYVPRLLITWLNERPDDAVHEVEGSMAFVDISGFTKLTERLARRGLVGAEEMSDILDATFGALLGVARADGAQLIKWGGDAVLLLYDGPDHAARAARSAFRMRHTLRRFTQRPVSSGRVSLRMSVGIHSGTFHLFLVGDPRIHRELIVSGPSASVTAEMEAIATAGQIAVSDATAALLPARLVGAAVGGGRLLRAEPELPDLHTAARAVGRADVGQLLPPRIRAHLRAASGESEHRPIAVAFVQFSGTDALVRERGVAALAAALDECVRNVQDATLTHDVTFFESDINRDGGKIMLTAGAPRSVGDDEERMLRAARLIVDRAGTLPLRIGVNRGHVFAGDFGPDFRRTYSVKGDAVNLAARVMAKARPGQVLATRDAISRSATLFRTDALEPFMVKGKARPVHAVSVGPIIGEMAREHDDGPFVGRDAELRRLHAALDSARAGSGTLVDIVGEPGIGKSRLVQEVRARAGDLTIVGGRSGAYESSTAYYPFRAVLRQALARRFGAEVADDPTPLVARLKDAAAELAPWLPLLGIPLDIRLPETTATRELDEQFRKAKLEEITVAALDVLLPGPTLIVLENAHLMDDASADLLRRLEDKIEHRPWVLVVTRRARATGYRPSADGRSVVHMELAAIGTAAAIELLASATQATPLTRQAMHAIAARAGGNPLFLGSLALIAGRSGSVSDLPDSVEDVVTSQIDRLDPHDRTLLRYAAVLGTRFPESELRELLVDRAQAVDTGALRRLGDFLDPDGPGRLRFRHALIRDVAYAGLPFRLRREMHDRAGRALEARPAAPESEPELLSLHFFHAGSYDKAWRYSRTAGERAQSRYAYAEAGEFFQRALDAAKRGASVADRDVAAVLETLGDVRSVAGSSRDALEAYRRARRNLAGDPVATGALLFKEAIIDQRLGKFTQSLRMLRRGLSQLTAARGPAAAAVRSKLATRYGFGRYLQGRPGEAIRWCRLGAEEAQRADDKATLAMSYNALFLACLRGARRPEAPYGDMALALYEQIDDLSGQGHCANNLAIAAHQEGRWADAERLFGRAAEIFARIGDVANEGNAVYNRCDLLVRQRRHAEAESLLTDALRTARAVDDEELVALALRERARACAGLGRHDEARALFEDARDRLDRLGIDHELIVLEAARAEAHLSDGGAAEALPMLDRVLVRAGEAGIADVLPTVHRLRAAALIELGRPQEAADAVCSGLDVADGADGGFERAMLLRTRARLAAAEGEVGADGADRAEAAIILRRLGVVI